MPRPTRVTQVGAGVSVPIPMNHRAKTFDATVSGVVLAAGTYSIEITTDDVQADDYDPATGAWLKVAEIGDSTVSAMARLASPVTACRLNVVSGTVELTVLGH